ncbi:nucleolar protein 16 [Glonium stellatum]|uniref:Nucleolar protein 16 n=1 Tax=Glonium stellatum TaxID=574774 RepID=A0A8E2JRT1_9PEZI|nr:nucleolar protein 16 [Glonium stellatum]
MGRELQKKKNRSSIAKVRQKPKSKKKILNNPIIAANWNQKETLSQNYRRLGLSAKLNHTTGGTEKTASTISSATPASESSNTVDKFHIPSAAPKTLAPLDARVERDPVTGKILRVLDDPNASKKPNPLNDPLNDLEDSDLEEWTGFANVPTKNPSATTVVQQLEAQALSGVRKAPRKQSAREQEWIQRLVEKYGGNYGAMFRDRKLNPMQQSEGDIKNRVKRWKENHSV